MKCIKSTKGEKQMKTKKIFGAAAITVAAAALASCNKANSANEIVFYNTSGQTLRTVIDEAVKMFEDKHPDYKVKVTSPGGYEEVKKAIQADLGAGTQPDIAFCYPDHVASYLVSGTVIDLKPLIEQESFKEIKDDLVEVYYQEGKTTNYANYKDQGYDDDSILTMPFAKSTELMYVNLDLLKTTTGSETIPTTWEEMWTTCAKIHQAQDSLYPLTYDSEANMFINYCMQNNIPYTSASGNHYLFSNEQAANYLDDLKTKFDAKLFTTATKANVNYTSALFQEKKTVFCIGSSAGAQYQAPKKDSPFKWAVAPIPGATGANGKVISQGPSLVMFDQDGDRKNMSEKEKMTFEFMTFLLDKDIQSSYSQTSGYNPVRKSVLEMPKYQEFLSKDDDIKAVAAKKATSLTANFYTSPVFNGSAKARVEVGTALVNALGNMSGQQALEQALANCGGN